VDRVILGAQGSWIHPLREGLCLCRGAVLVRAADVDRREAPRPAKPGENVCRLWRAG
jgi:hypothetical protein